MVEAVPQIGKRIRQKRLTYKLVLKMNIENEEYSEMMKLAKELGMTDMRQYVKYCMVAILESHKEGVKLESSLEAY